MNKIALKLLERDKVNINKISGNGNTPLIHACRNKMVKVAFKLLETGKSNPSQVENNGFSAIYWANKNNLPLSLKEKIIELSDIEYKKKLGRDTKNNKKSKKKKTHKKGSKK